MINQVTLLPRSLVISMAPYSRVYGGVYGASCMEECMELVFTLKLHTA
jgi:hypothetical protein